MMSTLNPHDDRNALSALFDGELQGDAARFALKRLSHDPQWRESFSRWQLVGDALRGQATAAAPLDFATGVATRLAREREGAVVAGNFAGRAAAPARTAGTATGARRRWLGGAALAASIAMAALFVTRPLSSGDPGPASAPVIASNAPVAPVAPVEAPTGDTAPVAPPAASAVVAAVAAAEIPRRAAERRSRGQSERAALRAQQRAVAVAVTAPAASEPVPVASASAAAVADPFRPLAEPITPRPWPRAALPNYPATGALTASSAIRVQAPSFYPFEPRLPSGEAPASGPAAGPQP